MDLILKVDDLSLSFGGLQVLRNARIDALRGKVTVDRPERRRKNCHAQLHQRDLFASSRQNID